MTNQWFKLLNSFLLSAALALAANVQTAGGPMAEKGFEVAARSDRSDCGFDDSKVELKMILRNKAGKESTRTLSIATPRDS